MKINYTEKDIKDAMAAVAEGLSIRKAAVRWRVPRSTLQDRMDGARTHKDASERYQRLSPKQEESLVKWVLAQAALNVPITHQQLRAFVSRLLAKGGDLRPLGKNWVEGFLRRHPEIAARKGGRVDS